MISDQPLRGRRPIPGLPPGEERLLAMVAALTSELAIMRERLDTVERIAAATGLIDRVMIEQFKPDADQTTERDAMRRRLIAKVFRPLRDDAERAAAEATRKEPT